MIFRDKKRKFLEELAEVFLKFKSKEEVIDFLEGILTPKELEEIPKRLQIVKLLKKGVSQREIAKRLGVSLGTITRGSNELKRGKFKNI